MSEQRADMPVLLFGLFAPGRFGLEFFEQRIEALVVPLEDLAVTLDPVHGLRQSLRFQFAWAPLRIDAHRDEARALKHFQMLGNGRLAHLERPGEFRHRGLSRGQPGKDRAAGGVGQSSEGEVEAFRDVHNVLLV